MLKLPLPPADDQGHPGAADPPAGAGEGSGAV